MRYYNEQELRKTPSSRDGINFQTESQYRTECANFIIEVGDNLGLHYCTVVTAINYFYCFFMEHSFKDFSRYVIACNCIFVSAKMEGECTQNKDLANEARLLLCDEHFKTFGKNPKDEVAAFGNIVVETVGSDLNVKNTYKYAEGFLQYIKLDKNTQPIVADTAWRLFNNSLNTTLRLQWQPELIAVGIVNLSIILHNIEVVDWRNRTKNQDNWWNVFFEYLNVDKICNQSLERNSDETSSNSSSETPDFVECQSNINYPPEQPILIPAINIAPPMIPTFPFYSELIIHSTAYCVPLCPYAIYQPSIFHHILYY